MIPGKFWDGWTGMFPRKFMDMELGHGEWFGQSSNFGMFDQGFYTATENRPRSIDFRFI